MKLFAGRAPVPVCPTCDGELRARPDGLRPYVLGSRSSRSLCARARARWNRDLPARAAGRHACGSIVPGRGSAGGNV